MSARRKLWAREHRAGVRLPVTVGVWEFQGGGGRGGADPGGGLAKAVGVQPLALPHSSFLGQAGRGQPLCVRVCLVAGEEAGKAPHTPSLPLPQV